MYAKFPISGKADEIQSFTDRKDMKMFFVALKTVYSPCSSGATSLLRWKMEIHFWKTKEISWRDGLNTSTVCAIAHPISMRMPSTDCHKWSAIQSLQLDYFPTVKETMKAVEELRSDKTPGSDAIPAEIYKTGGKPMLKNLQSCSTVCGGRRQYQNN